MNKKILITAILLVLAIAISIYVKSNKTTSYSDTASTYTISAPKDWVMLDSSNATTTSNLALSNGSSTITVKRFDRTERVEEAIRFMGKDEFYVFLTDQIKSEIDGYQLVSTSTVKINNLDFYKAQATYVGKKTQKEVTQYAYFILGDTAYYIIGIDVYTEILDKSIVDINRIVNTFTLSNK
jgi:hypothetical protein